MTATFLQWTASWVACPDCPAAHEARALVLSERFWLNVWFAVLPFVLIAIVVQHVVRRLDRGARDDHREE
jgi:hypothetical protein